MPKKTATIPLQILPHPCMTEVDDEKSDQDNEAEREDAIARRRLRHRIRRSSATADVRPRRGLCQVCWSLVGRVGSDEKLSPTPMQKVNKAVGSR